MIVRGPRQSAPMGWRSFKHARGIARKGYQYIRPFITGATSTSCLAALIEYQRRCHLPAQLSNETTSVSPFCEIQQRGQSSECMTPSQDAPTTSDLLSGLAGANLARHTCNSAKIALVCDVYAGG